MTYHEDNHVNVNTLDPCLITIIMKSTLTKLLSYLLLNVVQLISFLTHEIFID